MTAHDSIRRFALSMLVAIGAFTIVNSVASWLRTPPCCDWIYSSGLPFRFMEEGGFQGMRHFLWSGVAANLGIVLATAFTVNWITTHIGNSKR
jgi:hypothetical protein